MFKIQIQLIFMMLFMFYFHIGCKKLPLSQVLKLFDSACCQDNVKDNVILSLTLWLLLSIKIELLYFLFLVILSHFLLISLYSNVLLPKGPTEHSRLVLTNQSKLTDTCYSPHESIHVRPLHLSATLPRQTSVLY